VSGRATPALGHSFARLLARLQLRNGRHGRRLDLPRSSFWRARLCKRIVHGPRDIDRSAHGIQLEVEIREDDPTREPVSSLLGEHLADMQVHSPPESIHALDIEALCSPDVTFWSAWEERELLGCGALLELDRLHGEIKSMRTAREHLRRGVAARLLQHIIAEAERRSYSRLSLETGSMDAFAPARALYARFGFAYCDPFASYLPDPNSVFMSRTL
jgi:putative acetyltransferase